jgi:hypothetical protein
MRRDEIFSAVSECRLFCESGHTGFSSTRVTGTNWPTFHVGREKHKAKFWFDPVRLAQSGGFRGHELNRLQQLTQKKSATIVKQLG